jgi:cytoskeletal protein CcmA (bactofilin family)
MALFGSKSSTEKQSESSTSSFIPPSSRTSKSMLVPEPPLQVNMIGKGATIEGTVKVKGDVRVGGKVKGEVHVEGKLVITPEGSIEGLIRTQEAEVGGKIKGDIICHGRLTLHKSTHLEGNIVAAKLVLSSLVNVKWEPRH